MPVSEAPRVPSSPAAPQIDLGPADAPAALLVHGLGGLAQEIASPLAEPLIGCGLRAVAFDRPGYGGTPALTGPAGPAAQAQWLAGHVRRLRLRRLLLIGHSLGAAIALCLARELGDAVAALVLVNPFCAPTPPAAAPLLQLATSPVVGAPVRRTLSPAMAKGLVRWSLARACAPDPVPQTLTRLPHQRMAQESAVLAMAAELRGFNADVAALPRDRARVIAPTFALVSPADGIIDGPRHGGWLASRFGAAVESLEGGHMLHHTRTPAVMRTIQAALRC
jgi:pimeloyl-ACP methyl ester carboxylesterase